MEECGKNNQIFFKFAVEVKDKDVFTCQSVTDQESKFDWIDANDAKMQCADFERKIYRKFVDTKGNSRFDCQLCTNALFNGKPHGDQNGCRELTAEVIFYIFCSCINCFYKNT